VKAQYRGKKNMSVFAVASLMLMAVTITVLGLAFGVYAVLNNVSFTVMRSEIPGVIFAGVVTFLGIRYLVSTVRLAKKIRNEQFTWKNFRKSAGAKKRSFIVQKVNSK
jgi:hypothetical protein